MTMFAFNSSILLGGVRTRALNQSALISKEGKKTGVLIFHCAVGSKDFNCVRELCAQIIFLPSFSYQSLASSKDSKPDIHEKKR